MRGYNGTPAWSFVVGGLFTRHLAVQNPVSRWLMLLLDPLLLVEHHEALAYGFVFVFLFSIAALLVVATEAAILAYRA